MKLLQLNMWGGRLMPQIEDLLKSEKPDILCIQEAISFSVNGAGLFIPIEQIQANFDFPFLSFAPVFSFNYMKGTARFGNGVMSRHPISKTEVVFTHQKHKDNFMWDESDGNMRNFVHSVVSVNSKPCNVISHHGYWVHSHKNGNEETLRQNRMIADYVKELNGPVIVAGDFNLVAKSESMNILNEVLDNLTLKHNLKTTRTNLTTKTEACDFILVNDGVKVKKFCALEEVASDHQALLLDFDI